MPSPVPSRTFKPTHSVAPTHAPTLSAHPTVSLEPTVSPYPTPAPSTSPAPSPIPSTYHPTRYPTSVPTSRPSPLPSISPSASPYPTVTSAPTHRRAIIDVKFNAIMAYVNATEINLPERCSRCAAARAALAQAFANALDVPVEWIVSIEARSMYFSHEFPRPTRRLDEATPRPRPARRLLWGDELRVEAPVVEPIAVATPPATAPSVATLADELRQRQLYHFDWHTAAPTYTPAPSPVPSPAPSKPPTHMFWPTRSPTRAPTVLPNVTMVGAVTTLTVADSTEAQNVTDAFVEQALIDLAKAVKSGQFLTDVQTALTGTTASDIFEDAVILKNQTVDWNAERCAEQCYDMTVTTDKPTMSPTTGAPTQQPTECGLTYLGVWWPCEIDGWPVMPWKFQSFGEATGTIVGCIVFCVFCFVFGKKFWIEYRDDAKKIYREGPYYRNVAKAFIRESVLECAATPWYVKDAIIQWWKMIFQVTEMDVRPWPGRVASEKRVCDEGQLQG